MTPSKIGQDLLQAAPSTKPADALDAARYRWLREQTWQSVDLCVVSSPANSLKLGAYCPSKTLLDVAIDEAMLAAAQQQGETNDNTN